MKRVVILAGASLCMACFTTRAPTTHELDRRAGLLAPGGSAGPQLVDVGTTTTLARTPKMPVKVPPLIEKVWVSDVPLGPDARLQGTWLYLEVRKGQWLDEVDPGGAPLVDIGGGARPAREGVATSSDSGSAAMP